MTYIVITNNYNMTQHTNKHKRQEQVNYLKPKPNQNNNDNTTNDECTDDFCPITKPSNSTTTVDKNFTLGK